MLDSVHPAMGLEYVLSMRARALQRGHTSFVGSICPGVDPAKANLSKSFSFYLGVWAPSLTWKKQGSDKQESRTGAQAEHGELALGGLNPGRLSGSLKPSLSLRCANGRVVRAPRWALAGALNWVPVLRPEDSMSSSERFEELANLRDVSLQLASPLPGGLLAILDSFLARRESDAGLLPPQDFLQRPRLAPGGHTTV